MIDAHRPIKLFKKTIHEKKTQLHLFYDENIQKKKQEKNKNVETILIQICHKQMELSKKNFFSVEKLKKYFLVKHSNNHV